jgi:ribosome biogenesis SPOUT family RNA methylase Rps3
LRGALGDLGVDRVAVRHLGRHQFSRQGGGILVALLLGEVTLEHSIGRALPEIRLEDRRKGESATGPPATHPVSPRRHRPAR